MPIITILLVLAAIGFLLWLINTYIPMPDPWKKVINIVAVILVVLWLLQIFGIFGDVWVGPTIHRTHTLSIDTH